MIEPKMCLNNYWIYCEYRIYRTQVLVTKPIVDTACMSALHHTDIKSQFG